MRSPPRPASCHRLLKGRHGAYGRPARIRSLEGKILFAISNDSDPLNRIIPKAPTPGGVATATIVSSQPVNLFMTGQNYGNDSMPGQLLFGCSILLLIGPSIDYFPAFLLPMLSFRSSIESPDPRSSLKQMSSHRKLSSHQRYQPYSYRWIPCPGLMMTMKSLSMHALIQSSSLDTSSQNPESDGKIYHA